MINILWKKKEKTLQILKDQFQEVEILYDMFYYGGENSTVEGYISESENHCSITLRLMGNEPKNSYKSYAYYWNVKQQNGRLVTL